MKNMRAFLRAVLLAIAAMALGCSKDEAKPVKAPTPPIDWAALSSQRVLFAHQSVGDNILEGVRLLAEQDGIESPVETWVGGVVVGGINHFRVGQNGDPQSKLAAFRVALASVDAQPPDIALLKFCYVDFNTQTDAKQLAGMYIDAYRELALLYPGTTFVAVTTPLTTIQTGPKAWIKRVVGIPVGQSVENAKRTEFNNLLRKTFGPSHRLFDLARIEASADRMPIAVANEAAGIEGMDPRLTYDGGHLNQEGKQLLASEILAYLSRVSVER